MSEQLSRITELARAMAQAQRDVLAAEEALSRAVAHYRQIEREDLPELMREYDLTEIKLKDGTQVTVSDEVECGITQDNKPRALEWLTEHNFGGLIKTEISLSWGRDEREAALAAARTISAALDVPVTLNETVHPQTLKAFVKERRVAGESPPETLFSIFPYAKAKVRLPRKTL